MASALQLVLPEWLAVVTPEIWVAILIVLLGVGIGYLTIVGGPRLPARFGIDDAVRGTAVGRTARE